jgi:hypothetical protein
MNLSGSILYNNLINGFVNASLPEGFGVGLSDIMLILLSIVVYYLKALFPFLNLFWGSCCGLGGCLGRLYSVVKSNKIMASLDDALAASLKWTSLIP